MAKERKITDPDGWPIGDKIDRIVADPNAHLLILAIYNIDKETDGFDAEFLSRSKNIVDFTHALSSLSVVGEDEAKAFVDCMDLVIGAIFNIKFLISKDRSKWENFILEHFERALESFKDAEERIKKYNQKDDQT